MTDLIKSVNQRTQLAGQNRFEMLIFHFNSKQRFGINVFKVKELIKQPNISFIPGSHEMVCGVATVRGKTIPVIDLAAAIGLEQKCCQRKYVIVTEFNRSVQGFLINDVERIVNIKWEDVLPPTTQMSKTYLTAIAKYEDQFVQIIDVEHVLADIVGVSTNVADKLVASSIGKDTKKVLVVDDSVVARKQVQRAMEQVGVECILANDGAQAYKLLTEQPDLVKELDLIISDIEMPEMDGYTLTTKIKSDPNLKHLYVVLHSSLSGEFNKNMVKQVGADKFIAKYDPNELAELVRDEK